MSLASPALPGNAKLEITPEMIKAGVEELCLYNSREDSPEVAVEMIFEAMMAVRRAKRHPLSGSEASHASPGSK